MKKLEKSIRHELADIAPGLRSGCYGLAGHYAGVMPSKGLVRDLYCDIDPDQGIVTGIRMYGAEGGREARDYYGESVDLSDALEHYLLQWTSTRGTILSVRFAIWRRPRSIRPGKGRGRRTNREKADC